VTLLSLSAAAQRFPAFFSFKKAAGVNSGVNKTAIVQETASSQRLVVVLLLWPESVFVDLSSSPTT
jgi:hypothetical protein